MLRRWWRVKSLHYLNLFWGPTTILGSRLKSWWGALRDLEGCLQNVPQPKDGSHFFFGDFHLKEAASAWRKASPTFKTSLWEQKGFLEDWAASKFPDICDSFLGRVHIALPLKKCICATQRATQCASPSKVVQSLDRANAKCNFRNAMPDFQFKLIAAANID